MVHMKTSFLVLVSLFFLACSQTPPVIPSAKSVDVQRKPAPKDCEEIGPVEGRISDAKGTFEQALDDLKREAAHRGANYVHLGASGAMGTSVRGVAYVCR